MKGVPAPPEASPRAARVARRIVTPIESFLHVEASSGIVLLIAATIAMVLANSSFAGAYHALLEAPLGFRVGSLVVEQPAHFWINDGLMTIFFFVVGLEIRREIHAGELSTLRRAALPAAAAVGGMVTPALFYLAIAGRHPEARSGWGVPMATDIAFAVGVLALLGKRVPPALRVLLLALAIIDDIGSILVIAIFYSGDLELGAFGIAAAGIAGIFFMQRLAIRREELYLLPGVVVWYGFLRAGVHPTIGGVLVGLVTPARAWFGADGLVAASRGLAERVEQDRAKHPTDPPPADRIVEEARRIDLARREAFSPAERLQHALHPWVAFVIMPIFALANAGVHLDRDALSVGPVSLGITAGLVLGKPVGIVLTCLVMARVGVATLPRGIGVRELLVLGIVAGVGFTMAIFVGGLAFSDAVKLAQAKTAILVASGAAIVLALLAGRLLLRPIHVPIATASEAERSDVE